MIQSCREGGVGGGGRLGDDEEDSRCKSVQEVRAKLSVRLGSFFHFLEMATNFGIYTELSTTTSQIKLCGDG